MWLRSHQLDVSGLKVLDVSGLKVLDVSGLLQK